MQQPPFSQKLFVEAVQLIRENRCCSCAGTFVLDEIGAAETMMEARRKKAAVKMARCILMGIGVGIGVGSGVGTRAEFVGGGDEQRGWLG